MTSIGSPSISLENLSLITQPAPTPVQASTSVPASPTEAKSGDMPKPVAGQGSNHHPLQVAARTTLLTLPREIRDQINDELDTLPRLALRATCRQANADARDLHFDVAVPNASKLAQALTFFAPGHGKADSMSIKAGGVPNNYRRNIRLNAQSYARRFDPQADFGVRPPSLTNLITMTLDQFEQLRGEGFKSLKRLELVGCRFSDQGGDVGGRAGAVLADLAPAQIRLVNNDWLTEAHLDQLYQAGTRAFSLVGNHQVSAEYIAQLASREGVVIDIEADADELEDRTRATGTGEFERDYADPMRRVHLDAEARDYARQRS